MNTDRLTVGGNPQRVRQAAYRVITRTQDDPPTQLLGTAIALTALCDATGVNVRRLLETADRMRNDLDGPFVSTFRALEAYAKNEIGRVG